MITVMADTLIAPDTKGLRPGAQAQGVEYALFNPDTKLYAKQLDNGELKWMPDLRDAEWISDFDELEEFAFSNDLTEPIDDYDWREIIIPDLDAVARPVFSEDDRIDAETDTPLEELDFSKLGISVKDFKTE